MPYYFMNDGIWDGGKNQPPRKEYLCGSDIAPDDDGLVRVLGADGNWYTLKPEQILEEPATN